MSKSFSSNGLVDDGDVDGVDISCFGRNKKKNVGDDGTEGDAEPAKSKYQVGWPGSLGPGNTKGGTITVLLTSCSTGLESAV